jgi:hypothetical protein
VSIVVVVHDATLYSDLEGIANRVVIELTPIGATLVDVRGAIGVHVDSVLDVSVTLAAISIAQPEHADIGGVIGSDLDGAVT